MWGFEGFVLLPEEVLWEATAANITTHTAITAHETIEHHSSSQKQNSLVKKLKLFPTELKRRGWPR